MFYRLAPSNLAPCFKQDMPLPVSKPAPAGQSLVRPRRKLVVADLRAVGEGSAPLSNAQKAKICILAKDAWIAVGLDEDFETWRHAEQLQACGVSSLVVASQRDYLKILGHFQTLAGEELRGSHSELRAESGPARTAWHILLKELAKKNLPQSYAAAIAKTQFKCTLGECSPKQLWCLVYTVRNRKKPTAKKPRSQEEKTKKYTMQPGKVFQKKPKSEEPF